MKEYTCVSFEYHWPSTVEFKTHSGYIIHNIKDEPLYTIKEIQITIKHVFDTMFSTKKYDMLGDVQVILCIVMD